MPTNALSSHVPHSKSCAHQVLTCQSTKQSKQTSALTHSPENVGWKTLASETHTVSSLPHSNEKQNAAQRHGNGKPAQTNKSWKISEGHNATKEWGTDGEMGQRTLATSKQGRRGTKNRDGGRLNGEDKRGRPGPTRDSLQLPTVGSWTQKLKRHIEKKIRHSKLSILSLAC